MAEETKPAETEPQGEGEVDYKALYEKAVTESRKWEKRSKANFEKAQKFDELAQGEESLEDRIAKLEADKKRLEGEKARAELVSKVAASTGLSESLVASLNGVDEKTLESQAKAVAALKPTGAPGAPEAGRYPREEAGTDDKRRFVRDLIGSVK